jgi:putative transposase
MRWKQLLTYITGSIDQELLRCNEYLTAENRILRTQIQGRVRLTDGDRKTLAEIGKRIGKQTPADDGRLGFPNTRAVSHP